MPRFHPITLQQIEAVIEDCVIRIRRGCQLARPNDEEGREAIRNWEIYCDKWEGDNKRLLWMAEKFRDELRKPKPLQKRNIN